MRVRVRMSVKVRVRVRVRVKVRVRVRVRVRVGPRGALGHPEGGDAKQRDGRQRAWR